MMEAYQERFIDDETYADLAREVSVDFSGLDDGFYAARIDAADVLAVLILHPQYCGDVEEAFLEGEVDGEGGDAEGAGRVRCVTNFTEEVRWMLEDLTNVRVPEAVRPHILRKLYNAVIITLLMRLMRWLSKQPGGSVSNE